MTWMVFAWACISVFQNLFLYMRLQVFLPFCSAKRFFTVFLHLSLTFTVTLTMPLAIPTRIDSQCEPSMSPMFFWSQLSNEPWVDYICHVCLMIVFVVVNWFRLLNKLIMGEQQTQSERPLIPSYLFYLLMCFFFRFRSLLLFSSWINVPHTYTLTCTSTETLSLSQIYIHTHTHTHTHDRTYLQQNTRALLDGVGFVCWRQLSSQGVHAEVLCEWAVMHVRNTMWVIHGTKETVNRTNK